MKSILITVNPGESGSETPESPILNPFARVDKQCGEMIDRPFR